MCTEDYRLPWVVPRCLNITSHVKSSMSQFRSLTEDALIQARGFARDITEIDGGR